VVNAHGAVNVDYKGLLAFALGSAGGLKGSNKPLAAAARGVLAALYHQLGTKFRAFVKSQVSDAAVAAALEADFDAIGYDPNKAAQFKAAAAAKAGAAGGGAGGAGGGAGGGDDALEIPRADIMSMLPGDISKRMVDSATKTSWQVRLKALEEVAAKLEEANHAIVLNKGAADLLRLLNERCVEANVNVKRQALVTVKGFFASVEAAKRNKVGRLIVEGIMQCFADKKDVIRESAMEAMKAYVAGDEEGEIDAACFLGCFKPMTAVVEMPAFRGLALGWLKHCLAPPSMRALNVQLVPLVPPLIACLCDRNSAIRADAEELLRIIHSAAPKKSEQAIQKVVQDLKPAEQRAVQATIASINAEVAAVAAPAFPVAAATAAPAAATAASNGSSSSSSSSNAAAAAAAPAGQKGAAPAGKENVGGGGGRLAPPGSRLAAPGAQQQKAAEAKPSVVGATAAAAAPTLHDDTDDAFGAGGGSGGGSGAGALLVGCPSKDRQKREQRYLKNKWMWDVAGPPRDDLVLTLKEDFKGYVLIVALLWP
jgi:hypothetical protein